MTGNWTKDSIAQLETVDAAGLSLGRNEEKQKLMHAAELTGLFNLWLGSTTDGKEILNLLPDIYRISDEYFAQPEKVKMQDFRTDQKPNQDRGYKSSDCDETFEVALDEFRDKTIKLPPSLQKDQATLEKFSVLCQKVCEDVLGSISEGLGLPKDELMQKYHQGPSDCGLKLISEPALAKLSDVGDNTHTDSGTLTMIFTDKWGILGKKKEADEWAFTEPVEGAALFNVANSLQRMTNGACHSPIHRVTQREDGAHERTFLSYYLRPSYVA